MGLLAKVFGFSIGLVSVFILVLSWRHIIILDLLKFIGLISVIVGALLIFAMVVVMGNKVTYEYTITDQGVTQIMGEKERRRNKVILGLSILAGSVRSTGAALMASSRETTQITWDDVKKIVTNDNRKTIQLKNNWITIMLIYCTPQNYIQVIEKINTNIKK
ncbi:hypothetical protein GF319_04425 [Candidatus Bathyarchaeota archaeon]|jgi:hypothetical protein|nr:hypothetical protein [Candidatus Bathyarchaeota archaeon]